MVEILEMFAEKIANGKTDELRIIAGTNDFVLHRRLANTGLMIIGYVERKDTDAIVKLLSMNMDHELNRLQKATIDLCIKEGVRIPLEILINRPQNGFNVSPDIMAKVRQVLASKAMPQPMPGVRVEGTSNRARLRH